MPGLDGVLLLQAKTQLLRFLVWWRVEGDESKARGCDISSRHGDFLEGQRNENQEEQSEPAPAQQGGFRHRRGHREGRSAKEVTLLQN